MNKPCRTGFLAPALLLLALAPTGAEEYLDLTGCGGGSLVIRAGDPARGLPHWDPVSGVLTDVLTIESSDGTLPPLLRVTEVDGDAEVRLSPQASTDDRDPRLSVRDLRAGSLLWRDRSTATRTWELRVHGEEAIKTSLLVEAGESCGEAGRFVYLAGHDGLIDPAGRTVPMPAENQVLAGSPNGGILKFQYDQLWPKAFIGSPTGWFLAGNRYPIGLPVQLLEVEFVTAQSGSGAGYQVMVFHTPEVDSDRPTLRDLVAVEPGVIPSSEGMQVVRVDLSESNLLFEGGTLWVAVRNLEGKSMALSVGGAFDHIGNSFVSTTNGEDFFAFGLTGAGDGRPMVRAWVETLGPDGAPGLGAQDNGGFSR